MSKDQETDALKDVLAAINTTNSLGKPRRPAANGRPRPIENVNPRLFDIIEAVKAVEHELIENGGELTDEIEARIVANDADVEMKFDAYAGAISYVKSQEDLLKEEAKRLTERARSYGNAREAMRSRMAQAMQVLGRDSIKTFQHTYSLRFTESWALNENFSDTELSDLVEQGFAQRTYKVDMAGLKKAVKEAYICQPDYIDVSVNASISIR